MMPASPWLSVIIPIGDKVWDIADCLQPLADSHEQGLEVILVDCGQSEDTTAKALELSRELKLALRTLSQPDAGAGAARNMGASQARGEILLFTQPDCSIPPGLAQRLKQQFVDSSLSAIGGTIRPSEPEQPLARLIALELSFEQNRPEREVEPCPLMACAAFRASVFKEAGMCNESLIHAEGHDRDLCLGILAQGGDIRHDPELWVNQRLPKTWGGIWRWQFRQGENRWGELRSGLRPAGEAYLQPALLLLALGLLLAIGPQDPARAVSLALICVLLLYPLNRAFLKYVGIEDPGLLKNAFLFCFLRPMAWVLGMLKRSLGRLGFGTK
jgi:hypothetical protein